MIDEPEFRFRIHRYLIRRDEAGSRKKLFSTIIRDVDKATDFIESGGREGTAVSVFCFVDVKEKRKKAHLKEGGEGDEASLGSTLLPDSHSLNGGNVGGGKKETKSCGRFVREPRLHPLSISRFFEAELRVEFPAWRETQRALPLSLDSVSRSPEWSSAERITGSRGHLPGPDRFVIRICFSDEMRGYRFDCKRTNWTINEIIVSRFLFFFFDVVRFSRLDRREIARSILGKRN